MWREESLSRVSNTKINSNRYQVELVSVFLQADLAFEVVIAVGSRGESLTTIRASVGSQVQMDT